MKQYRYLISILCIVLGFTYISSLVFADDNEFTRSTLKGVQGMGIFIENVNPDIEKDGLTRDQIRKDVERTLQTAGINILSEEERSQEIGSPYLYVNVHMIKMSEEEYYICNIYVGFRQDATLVRNPDVTTESVSFIPSVATWSIGTLGISSELNDIQDSIKEQIDKFIDAYRSVNL